MQDCGLTAIATCCQRHCSHGAEHMAQVDVCWLTFRKATKLGTPYLSVLSSCSYGIDENKSNKNQDCR